MQGQNLKYILEVHKMRSISKAAQKLNISQPALSAHIKKIEESLGVPVFDRSIKPIQLTEAWLAEKREKSVCGFQGT